MNSIELFVLVLLSQIDFSQQSAPVIDLLKLGKLQGDTGKTINGRTYYSFEGVPYARAPVGKYRFREPQPVKPWADTWVAKTLYRCIQYDQFSAPNFVVGDEDCLYLNIYTPKLDEKANMDVIVYIHGGCFMFNYGGQFQPDYILDRDDVVFISLNYRLGPLGFLSTENDLIPGNNGIKDQIMALQWIQNNIKQFGGNPKSVTITGMSAGGASVHLHYLSPKSDNLFHRGISQSGVALNPWVLMEDGLEKAKKLGATIGCSTKDLKKMVECLKRKPARQIVGAVKEFLAFEYNPFSPFGVVIDSWSSDPVLPQHPYKLIEDKKVKDLPWIASMVNSEGMYPAGFLYKDELLQEIESRWNELLPFILDYNYTVDSNLKDTVSEQLRKYYLKNEKLTKTNFMEFVKLCSDRMFIMGIEKALRAQSKVVSSPIYHYIFAYRGAHSKTQLSTGTDIDFGAAHADDTSYIFKTMTDTQSTENDRELSRIMVDIFVSFARNGKPKTPVEWVPVGKNGKINFLSIESPEKIQVKTADSLYDHKLWDSLPIKENEKLFHVKDEL